jgi:hypothetical protein
MQNLRRGVVVLLIPLLSLFLFAFAVNLGVVKIITHPATIKKILNDSGLYNSLVGNLLDQSKSITSGDTTIPLTNPAIRAAANKAIPSDYVKQNTENFIDSVYAWLEGETQTPDFSVNILSIKTQFANNVANDLTQRLSELPSCTPGTSFAGFDAFNATCLPRGVTVDQAAATVKDNILNGQGFLDEDTLNADSVKSNDSGQPVFANQLKDAPETYQKVKKSPFILGFMAVLVAAGIIFLGSSKRLGFRKVGLVMFSIGVLILFVAWAMNNATDKVINKISLNGTITQQNVRLVVKDVVLEVDKLYWVTGAVYAIVGGSMFAGSIFLFRKDGSLPSHKPSKQEAAEEKPGHETTATSQHNEPEPPSETDRAEPEEGEKIEVKVKPAVHKPKAEEAATEKPTRPLKIEVK